MHKSWPVCLWCDVVCDRFSERLGRRVRERKCSQLISPATPDVLIEHILSCEAQEQFTPGWCTRLSTSHLAWGTSTLHTCLSNTPTWAGQHTRTGVNSGVISVMPAASGCHTSHLPRVTALGKNNSSSLLRVLCACYRITFSSNS